MEWRMVKQRRSASRQQHKQALSLLPAITIQGRCIRMRQPACARKHTSRHQPCSLQQRSLRRQEKAKPLLQLIQLLATRLTRFPTVSGRSLLAAGHGLSSLLI